MEVRHDSTHEGTSFEAGHILALALADGLVRARVSLAYRVSGSDPGSSIVYDLVMKLG